MQFRTKLRRILAVALCLTLGCVLGAAGNNFSQAYAQDGTKDLKTFENALAIIQKNNVPAFSTRQLIDYAIGGMLSSLDPHSVYLTGEMLRDREVDIGGRYGGLGIQIVVKNGVVTIKSVMDGTPAYKAGLKQGDRIVKIDGDPVKNMTFTQAKDRMRGPKGSSIELVLERAGLAEPMALTLTRDTIEIAAVKSRELAQGFMYLQLAVFQQGSDESIANAIAQFRKQHQGQIKGMVLDLRDNPGGLLSQAVKIADQFLDAQQIVYTQGRGVEPHRYYSHRKDHYYDYPMAVLVNAGSASASEILAGALQANDRAVVVGTRTFGKGSVQTLIPVDDRSALQLTTALYYTPNGCSIQAIGISPDVAADDPHRRDISEDVELTDSEASAKEKTDPQLHKALDVLQYWDSFKTQLTRAGAHHSCRVG